MKALIQRVSSARVEVKGETIGQISKGVLIFLGVGKDDSNNDVEYLVDKIINLRIFENGDKHMDQSIIDIKGELLIVSQFTLFGSTKKGRRPDFNDAADPELANNLYEQFIKISRDKGIKTETGKFAAMMNVTLTNDGPVTFMIDSKANM